MREGFSERFQRVRQERVQNEKETVDNEVTRLIANHNDKIPPDVWDIIQDNGRVATERLNEILTSRRFHRLSANEQAKLIQLAQDRAYGKPDPGIKRIVKGKLDSKTIDAVAHSLASLSDRAMLPEYNAPQDANPPRQGQPQSQVGTSTDDDRLDATSPLHGPLRGSQE